MKMKQKITGVLNRHQKNIIDIDKIKSAFEKTNVFNLSDDFCIFPHYIWGTIEKKTFYYWEQFLNTTNI